MALSGEKRNVISAAPKKRMCLYCRGRTDQKPERPSTGFQALRCHSCGRVTVLEQLDLEAWAFPLFSALDD